MAICVNFNICDNSKECSAIGICPTGALYWAEDLENARGKQGTIAVNNNLCTSCGLCIGDEGCPIGAILFSENESGLKDFTDEVTLDKHRIEQLFVERYGGEPLTDDVCISEDELKNVLCSAENKIVLIEEFTGDSIQCLLHSIPIASIITAIREFLPQIEKVFFYKREIPELNAIDKDYPRLCIYRSGALKGVIEGYYDETGLDEMVKLIKNILK